MVFVLYEKYGSQNAQKDFSHIPGNLSPMVSFVMKIQHSDSHEARHWHQQHTTSEVHT